MIRKSVFFPIADFEQTRLQLLNWAARFSNCSFLDNHQYQSDYNQQECLVAAGSRQHIQRPAGMALQQLQLFINAHPGQWFFGHLAYDLKNEIEPQACHKQDAIDFADLHFFIPEIVVRLNNTEIIIDSFNADHDAILKDIITTVPADYAKSTQPNALHIQAGMHKDQYIDIINKLRHHILRGDCYEINFCQHFFAKNAVVEPLAIYQKLSYISPNPFSAFYRQQDKYLLCASPERYLMKRGQRIISQPIKGTASRNALDAQLDDLQKTALQQNPKERSENVMVVDLVRNDLSKICEAASVKVDELFGVYTYPQVHQLVSTISGMLRTEVLFTDIIKATYPMGSMTGAPKNRVMELIEQYEHNKRGLYSGAVGYIDPNGDFDFNVVIRSILYNKTNQYLSYQVGSGITFYSDAEKEYEECILKAEAIRKVLG